MCIEVHMSVRPARSVGSVRFAGGRPLAIADAVVVAEASVERMPISTGAENTFRYGIVDVTGTLVAADDRPGIGWPYVEGLLFGGDLTMTIAYRLTVITST
ncbi:MAG TPA: hypothetical protein VLN74_08735 [Ilumatobacteraceae bacterium]|nr:hypothetical protein [Ilumatobacteraceae bacterium]